MVTVAALTVLSDAGMVEQVLMNFAINFEDAMDGAGVVTTSTELAVFDLDFMKRHG